MSDLTTLQLARKIADAVWLSLHPSGPGPNRHESDAVDPPTQAVLRVLHETGSWFCKWCDEGQEVSEGEDYEYRQPDMFT